MDHRRLPAHDLRHQAVHQFGVGPQFRKLVGELAEPQQPAGHRVARRVVAAHQEQDQDAHAFAQGHPLRRLAMRHDRDHVEAFRLLRAILPEFVHVFGEFHLFGETRFFCPHRRIRRVDVADESIGPADQARLVLDRIVEQSCQHHRGQLDRDVLHPVEGFVARQPVQHHVGALADQGFHLGQGHRVDRAADFAPLFVVLWWVHADEAGALHAFRRILDLNAADLIRRRKHLVVDFNLDDVAIFRHGPVRAIGAVLHPVHRGLAPQTLEIRLPDVVVIDLRVAGVDLVERHRTGVGSRIDIHRCIHSRPPGFLFSVGSAGLGSQLNASRFLPMKPRLTAKERRIWRSSSVLLVASSEDPLWHRR